MENSDLLKDPIFSLPKSRTIDFLPEFFDEIFKEYLSKIDEFTGNEGNFIKANKDNIKQLCDQIINCVSQYYKGYTSNAYNSLESGIHIVEKYLMISKGNYIMSPSNENLFRVRTGGNKLYSKREMFHIPFEKREFVKPQRYSIPGLPCLYLGNTIYICWEELRRPDINLMQVSRFEIDTNAFKVLDLSFIPIQFIQTYDILKKEIGIDLTDFFVRYIVTWPLIAACSIATKNDDATFNPEHIVPQLLLQWVCSTHKLDGIKFFSTRVNSDVNKTMGANINYVFPVKNINKIGLCDVLTKKIKLTDPISWQLLNITNPVTITQPTSKDDIKLRVSKSIPGIMFLELLPGKPLNYLHTAFGKLEIELCKMEAHNL